MLKGYDELRKLDVTAHTEKRDEMDYLNWAKCIDLLHENGAEKVYFEPLVNEKGSSLFMTEKVFKDKNGVENQCYEVGVKVVVDDNEWIFRGPLMNAANPVKDNSMSQQRVWNCQTRLFVKCIAIHTGLGFQLWVKEEENDEKENFTDDLYKHNIMAIKERVERLITVKLDGGLSKSDICKGLKVREDQFDIYMKQYAILDYIEKELQKL